MPASPYPSWRDPKKRVQLIVTLGWLLSEKSRIFSPFSNRYSLIPSTDANSFHPSWASIDEWFEYHRTNASMPNATRKIFLAGAQTEWQKDSRLVKIMMRGKSWRDAYQPCSIVIQFPAIVDSTFDKQLENEVTTIRLWLGLESVNQTNSLKVPRWRSCFGEISSLFFVIKVFYLRSMAFACIKGDRWPKGNCGMARLRVHGTVGSMN